MDKKQHKALIARVWPRIGGPQDGFSTVRDKMFRLCLASEKDHRKWSRGAYGCSANDAAKLFTIRYLAAGLDNGAKWTVDDVTSVRTELLYGQAYANKHHDEFTAAFGDDLAACLALDYCTLIGAA